jgi:hypothetical protein
MKKTEFKALVKEVLLEILNEGLLASAGSSSERENLADSAMHMGLGKANVSEQRVRQQSNRNPKDLISFGPKANSGAKNTPTHPLVENAVISSLTSNSALAAILQDTASTTLREQISADRKPGSNLSALSDSDPGIDVGSLFGDSASNWASLAFPDRAK